MSNLDLFSLEEDDDFGNLSITQEPTSQENMCVEYDNGKVENNDKFLSLNKDDFVSPCTSFSSRNPQYSDISDDEVFENKIPNSQKGGRDITLDVCNMFIVVNLYFELFVIEF